MDHSPTTTICNSPSEEDKSIILSCTAKCKSVEHGNLVWEAGLKNVSDQELIAYWESVCQNYAQVRDYYHRTALHAAVFTGRHKVVEWLIRKKRCNINVKELVSGYTPMHFALFFGQVHIARNIIKHSPDLSIRDHDGLSPIDFSVVEARTCPKHVVCDRDSKGRGSLGSCFDADESPTELLVWGTNENYNLGLENQATRSSPEVLDKFRKEKIYIKEVAMNSFHTLFLSQAGDVFACGYGLGGRLGTGVEESFITPTKISFGKWDAKCVKIASGIDHSLFLLDNGRVLICGSNEYGALGQKKEIVSSLVPRVVHIGNHLSHQPKLVGISAGKHSSFFYSNEHVYSCGLNNGALGLIVDSPYIYAPEKIDIWGTRLWLRTRKPCEAMYSHIVCTENAMVLRLTDGTILIYSHFQCRSLRAKHFNVVEFQAFECQSTRRSNEQRQTSLSILMLCHEGGLLVWNDEGELSANSNYSKIKLQKKAVMINGTYYKMAFNISRPLTIVDFCVSHAGIAFVTLWGDAYKTSWSSTPMQQVQLRTIQPETGKYPYYCPQKDMGMDGYVSRDTRRELFKLKKIQNVYSGGKIMCDPKGNNLAILQRAKSTTSVLVVKDSSLNQHLNSLLEETGHEDSTHDVVFHIGHDKFPAHLFIMAHRCPKLYRLARKNCSGNKDVLTINLSKDSIFKDITGLAFRKVLQYLYSNGIYISSDADDTILKECLELSKILELSSLTKLILSISKISAVDRQSKTYYDTRAVKLDRKAFKQLYDVSLKSVDGDLFQAHKCILVSRLDYFRSIYMHNFMEKSSKKPISIPFSSKAVGYMLDFLYTDSCESLKEEDMEFLIEMLVLSGHFLIERLCNMVEKYLSELILAKNVVDLLQIGEQYNAYGLVNACVEYISMNLPMMLEHRILDPLSTDLMELISSFYRKHKMIDTYRAQILTERDPTDSTFQQAVESMPEEFDQEFRNIETFEPIFSKSKKSRVRLRSRTLSDSEPPVVVTVVNPETDYNSESQVDKSHLVVPETMLCSPTQTKQQKPRKQNSVPIPTFVPEVEIEHTCKKVKMLNLREFPVLGESAEKNESASSDVKLSSSPNNTQKVPNGAGSRKKTKWKALESDNNGVHVGETQWKKMERTVKDDYVEVDANPWKLCKPAAASTSVGFEDIIKQEQEKNDNLRRLTTKSLRSRQIEEEFMNFLREQYWSDDVKNGVEVLEVSRIQPESYADLTWVAGPKNNIAVVKRPPTK